MIKNLKLLALCVLTLSLSYCSNDDDNGPSKSDLTLDINGLEDLGSDFVYEGWIMVDASPQTTGRFSVNDSGDLSKTSFALDSDDLAAATAFILTIEPAVGDDPAPSDTHLIAGDFSGDMGALTIAHGAALGDDFNTAAGDYILATPTNGSNNDEKSGIWFLDLNSGSPAVGLDLPVLPAGWKYEGWAVQGQPITTGTFLNVDAADDFDEFSGGMSGPPFPGEDFLVNAPSGLAFPLDLSGGTAVISIEPDPDNSPAPFLLKPLVGAILSDAVDHVTYPMTPNLNFPTGTVSR
ncbi:anti-sigma factor [Tamlana agarivorans]|uniref:Anti-sigma factor n=1 Tax=Pseudotamlana agarivorans TaxID=481183 RepID=A0ACC5UBA4_9FLAO|nr:anti-sigma factor [Tamlana agarivorans]MBU2951555.1 anti-sigma factor [Tamlana agarivorans]